MTALGNVRSHEDVLALRAPCEHACGCRPARRDVPARRQWQVWGRPRSPPHGRLSSYPQVAGHWRSRGMRVVQEGKRLFGVGDPSRGDALVGVPSSGLALCRAAELLLGSRNREQRPQSARHHTAAVPASCCAHGHDSRLLPLPRQALHGPAASALPQPPPRPSARDHLRPAGSRACAGDPLQLRPPSRPARPVRGCGGRSRSSLVWSATYPAATGCSCGRPSERDRRRGIIQLGDAGAGATVEAIRNVMHFPNHQHLKPIAVGAAPFIGALITLMLAARRGRSPATV
jgi:hypothetical protein